MTIYDQIKEVLKEHNVNDIVTSEEMHIVLMRRYGTNPGSVILSDLCYNRFNKGIPFKKHLFEFLGGGNFKYLGENFPYTGKIFHKPKGGKEVVVGEWVNGSIVDSSQKGG